MTVAGWRAKTSVVAFLAYPTGCTICPGAVGCVTVIPPGTVGDR